MRTLPYAIALFAALSLIGLAGAAGANAQMNSYLSQFLPQSIINSSTVINQSVGSNTYSMYEIRGNTFVIVNTTNAPNHYSVVTSNASIHSIISSYIFSKYYSNGLFNNLTSYVNKFTAAANPGFASCVSAIQATNNSSVVVANGVANFTAQYDSYKSNYQRYDSLAANLSSSNVLSGYSSLISAALNTIAVKAGLNHSTILPPPAGFNFSLYRTCSPLQAFTTSPWYCQETPLCTRPNFDQGAIDNITSQVAYLEALPLSNTSISRIADNSSKATYTYVAPVILKQETAQYDGFLNSTYPLYNSTVKNASSLISKVSSPSIDIQLSNLESNFSYFMNEGPNGNIAQENASIQSMIKKLGSTYASLSAAYAPLYSLYINNTAKINSNKLDFQSPPAATLSLEKQEAAVNTQIASGISNSSIPTITAELTSINDNLSRLPSSISFSAFAKGADGWFASPLAAAVSPSILGRDGAAPAFAALLSLIIGIIIAALFYYFTFYSLVKRHKLRRNRKTMMAWMYIFGAIFLIIIIYAVVTYLVAAGANTFLPFSGFASSFRSSNTINIVAYSNSTIQCANALKAAFPSKGISINTNVSCSLESGTCLANLASKGPVIVMSTLNSSSIYKGFYGSVLYANSDIASGSSCVIRDML